MKVYVIKRIIKDETFYMSKVQSENWTQSPVDTQFYTDKGFAERRASGWDKSMGLEVVPVKIVEENAE